MRLGDTLDELVFDLAVLVRQNVALGDDRPPGHLRMRQPKSIRQPARRLANNFDLTLNSRPQKLVDGVVFKGFARDEPSDTLARIEHVAQVRGITVVTPHTTTSAKP